MRLKAKTRIGSLIFAIAAMVAMAATTAAAPASGADPSPCPGADALPLAVGQAEFNGATLCLLNNERRKRGLPALRSNQKLERAAMGHTSSMRWGGYFAHDEPSGSTFSARIKGTGYTKNARRWGIGENLAWGTGTLGSPQSLVVAWMNSPPHRVNILNGKFREIGIGTEWATPRDANATNGSIVTTDFGFAKRSR